MDTITKALESTKWAIISLREDPEEGKELYQDVCVAIIKRRNNGLLNNPQGLRKLIMTIAHNKNVDYIRHITKVNFEPLSDNHVNSLATENDYQEDVQPIMERLSDKYQEILSPIINEGLSEKEVASRLGMPYETVRTRIKRAIKKIKTFNQENQN